MYQKLIKWSQANYSHLPWRENRSLYTTLVSEIMLQQTTVSTVINHFQRFINKYPSITELARASEEEVLIEWKGLGYYRRAKNLLKAAKEIENSFGGSIPLNFDQLKSINGIGDYTANALLSIGEDIRALSVDANLERVLSRIYGIKEVKGSKLHKEIYAKFAAKEICNEIEDIGARVYNEALMDLGRSICQARKAACEICPLKQNCYAFKNQMQAELPTILGEKKTTKYYDLVLLRVICLKENKLLAYRKEKNEWLSGQYEIPTLTMFSEDEGLKQYPNFTGPKHIKFLPEFKTSITKYRIVNKVIYVDEKDLKLLKIKMSDFEWMPLGEKTNLSTASFKSLGV